MNKKGKIPDAWDDDDWEKIADVWHALDILRTWLMIVCRGLDCNKQIRLHKDFQKRREKPSMPKQIGNYGKQRQFCPRNSSCSIHQAHRRTSEAPESFHFLETSRKPPLKSDFKPAVRLLSRKPAELAKTKVSSRLDHGDEDDSEEEARKEQERTFAERQSRAQREREEKQKKYAETRERLFGSPTPTPATAEGSSSGRTSPSRKPRTTKSTGTTSKSGQSTGGRNSPNDQSPVRSAPQQARQLFDPSYGAKPNSTYVQKRDIPEGEKSKTPKVEDQHIRTPRRPDSGGQAGFGIAQRRERNPVT